MFIKIDQQRNNVFTLMFRSICQLAMLVFINLGTVESAHSQEEVTVSVVEHHDKHIALAGEYALSWAIFEKAALQADIVLVPVETSWETALTSIQNQSVDFVFGALKLDSRTAWAAFSKALYSDGSGIFARPTEQADQLVDIDFDNTIVGVFTKSYTEIKKLKTELGFASVYSVDHRPQLYKMLDAGRLDYIFVGSAFVDYYCVYENDDGTKDCLKQVGPLTYKHNRHVLTDKKNKRALHYLGLINEQIGLMRNSGQLKQLFLEYGKTNSNYNDWSTHTF